MEKGNKFDRMATDAEEKSLLGHHRAFRFVRHTLIGFIIISIANLLFSYLFYTPKLYALSHENHELINKYNILHERINAHLCKVNDIAHRDNYVYRSLFGLDTITQPSLALPVASSRCDHLLDDPYYDIMSQGWVAIDNLASRLYNQSLSLDKLQEMVQDKEALSTAIPAVWPIDRTKLKHGIGGYGMRLHPIYKRYLMHKGIDLACDSGNPVYATGDATVIRSVQGYKYSGYGQEILLDHKYGYKTRYAHLSERLVKVGDKVKRGDIIGLIGSTGGSTGPHLHYEVILNNKTVDPANYFNRDMNNEEYMQLMEQMQDANFEVYELTTNDDE